MLVSLIKLSFSNPDTAFFIITEYFKKLKANIHDYLSYLTALMFARIMYPLGIVHYQIDGSVTIPIFDERDRKVYDIYFPKSTSELPMDNNDIIFVKYPASTGKHDPHLPVTLDCQKFQNDYIKEVNSIEEWNKLNQEIFDLDIEFDNDGNNDIE